MEAVAQAPEASSQTVLGAGETASRTGGSTERRRLSKVKTLREAVRSIPHGAHLTFSGFAHSLAPLAVVREIIRQGIGDLEVSAMGEAWAVDLLCGAGLVRRVRMSNFMFEGFGRCRNFSRAVESGVLEVEDYSHFGITSRFMAQALGVPFLPVRVMRGSDIDRRRHVDGADKMAEVDCPFTGERIGAVKALAPDIAIIHVSRADSEGNLQLFGATSVIEEQARAARRIIATAEEIVPTDVIRRSPEATIIPGMMVEAVVEAPFGAHPAGMYRYYDADNEHIAHYIDCSRDPKTFREYLDTYVHQVEDHLAYLDRIGVRRLMTLRADPYWGYSPRARGIEE